MLPKPARGIGVRTGNDTKPLIENNDCYENDMAGIGARENASPTIVKTAVTETNQLESELELERRRGLLKTSVTKMKKPV